MTTNSMSGTESVENSVLLHALIDAPDPPQWLIAEAAQIINQGAPTQATMNNWGEDNTARTLHLAGTTCTTAFNHACFLSDRSLTWAKSLVTALAKDIRISFTLPGLERCGPHIDRTRDYTLIYLLEPGGIDHRTVFYKEKGQQAVLRELGYHVDDYDNVQQIAQIKQPTERWNLLQGRVLHSIENIQNGRMSIQISLDNIDNLVLLKPTWWCNDR